MSSPMIRESVFELRGCPFCGSERASVYREGDMFEPAYYVECLRCHCRGPVTRRMETAAQAWKARPAFVAQP